MKPAGLIVAFAIGVCGSGTVAAAPADAVSAHRARFAVRAIDESVVDEVIPDADGTFVVVIRRQGVDAEITVSDGLRQPLRLSSPAPLDAIDTFVVEGRARWPVRISMRTTDVSGPNAAIVLRTLAMKEPIEGVAALTAAYVEHSSAVTREETAVADIVRAIEPRDVSPAPLAAPPAAEWNTVSEAFDRALARFQSPGAHPEGAVWGANLVLAKAAVAYFRAGDWGEAVLRAQEAAARFDSLEESAMAVRARVIQAAALIESAYASKRSDTPERQPDAQAGFEKARELLVAAHAWYRARARTADQAFVENLLGAANHYQGNWNDARLHYERAAKLYDRVPPSFRRAVVAQNLAVLANESGRAQEAELAFQRAERLIARYPQPDMLATILENSGATASTLGRQDDSVLAYSRALAIRRAQGSEPDIARCLMGIGVAISRTGDWRSAAPYLEQAWEIRGRRRQQERRAWLASGLAMTELYRARGELARAAELAASLEPSATSPVQRARLAMLRGRLAIERREFRDAAIFFDLAQAQQLPPAHHIPALARLGKARALLELGEANGAAAVLDAATRTSSAGQLTIHEPESELLRSAIASRLGRADDALRRIETAIALSERLSSRFLTPESRARFLASRRELFETAIELTLADETAASRLASLLLSERARASAMESLISSAEQRRLDAADGMSGLAATLGELDLRLARMDVLSERPVANAREIGALTREISELQTRARVLQSRRMDAGVPETAITSFDASLRARLGRIPPDSAIVEFFVGRRFAVAWVLRGGELSMRRVTRSQGALDELRSLASSSIGTGAGDEAWQTRLRSLARILIEPILAQDVQRLVIIPDTELFNVPFAALGTDELRQRLEITVAPSLALLQPRTDTLQRSIAAGGKVLVVADPVFGPSDPRVPAGIAQHTALALEYGRLPATLDEAGVIRSLLPSAAVTVLTGTSANHSSVVQALGRNPAIAHFATHAIVRPSDSRLSFLALSAYGEKWQSVPSRLYAWEIGASGLTADLVVLSACRSSTGEIIAGELPSGLAYHFLANGASAVLATLWPVPDAFAAEFMRTFYGELLRTATDPSAALAAARAAALRSSRWRDPYYWGAFSLLSTGI